MLMAAIDELWIAIHGPPKELIFDGEAAMARSDAFNRYLSRKGIHPHVRGKEQHARYVGRRGALLRDCVHRIEGQLKEEGVQMPFGSVLAEAVFCGNALLAINGYSPYSAVYGRVPDILPSIEQVAPPDAERDPPLVRHSHRLREIAVQSIVEGSARARLGRALNARTTMSAENMNLRVGEEIDFFRPQGTKDASGWFGPAVVIDISKATRGVITLRFQGQVTEAMVQNVRRHLHSLVYQAAALRRPFHHTNVWETIAKVPEQLAPGVLRQFGQIWDSQGWHRAAFDSTHPGWIQAVWFYAENHLHMHPVVSARTGRGLRKLPAVRGYTRAVTLLWAPGKTHTPCVEQQSDSGQSAALAVSRYNSDWSTLRVLQMLLGCEEVAITQAAGGGGPPELSPPT